MKKDKLLITLSLLSLVVFCVVAALTRALDFPTLPSSFLGAALGAVITGVVTVFLLKGQTAAEEDKERNVKIFELKKEAFGSYMNSIWDIWADQKIEDTEFEKLCSEYYKNIAMYLDKPETRDEFAKRLIEIGKCLSGEFADNYAKIKENVFALINILVGELKLGGKVDEELHNQLEKVLFPGFFKKAISTEIYKVLEKHNAFQPGKYETIQITGDERLCFYFIGTHGSQYAKLTIGPFNEGVGDLFVDLFIEKYMDSFFPNSKVGFYKIEKKGWGRRIIQFDDESAKYQKVTQPAKDEKDGEVYCIDFDNIGELEKKYVSRYHKAAETLARRVGSFVDDARIDEKDNQGNSTGKKLSIFEFMRQENLID